METASPPKSVKATALKVRVNGHLETVHLMFDESGELVGALNITALREWMTNRGEFMAAPRAKVITDQERRDIRLFGTSPCWFEGCEELRAAYHAELDQSQKRSGCSNCERGAINKKYLQLAAAKQANASA